MRRDEVQPYFRAFMIERGYHDSAEAANLDYLMWNGARWRQFDAITGRKAQGSRSTEERGAFGIWLEDRSIDFLAREAVEHSALPRPLQQEEKTP